MSVNTREALMRKQDKGEHLWLKKKNPFKDYNSQAVHANATSSISAINRDEKRNWLNK